MLDKIFSSQALNLSPSCYIFADKLQPYRVAGAACDAPLLFKRLLRCATAVVAVKRRAGFCVDGNCP